MSIEKKLETVSAQLDIALPILQALALAAQAPVTAPIKAGGIAVAETTPPATTPELVLTWTPAGEALKTTFDAMREVGWTDESMIKQGHAAMAPAKTAGPVTADELEAALGAKAAAMGDQGAAIYKVMLDKYKVTGFTDLAPEHYANLLADVEAL